MVDKTVIGPDGNTVGVVKDVAFSLDGKLGIVVDDGDGEERTLSVDEIQGVGEYVLLRPDGTAPPPTVEAPTPPSATAAAAPKEPASAEGTSCASCGRVNKAGSRFCGGCGNPLT